MDIAEKNEHLKCFRFDTSGKPAIELVKFAKGVKGEVSIRTNEVLFCMEGRLQLLCEDFPNHKVIKGQIIFLPSGGVYSFHALSGVELLVFRIHEPIRLCDNLSMEKLYGSRDKGEAHRPNTKHCSVLDINPRIWHFLYGVIDCVADGVQCHSYFELKIKEFFHLLRIYYPRDGMYDFFYLILSGDTAFSEYVRGNWHRFRNVAGIAEDMRMTPRQFSAKFKAIFGKTASRWMIEGRAGIILLQLTATNKSVKQVALENGFTTSAELTKFCKKELGATPTDIRAGKKRKL